MKASAVILWCAWVLWFNGTLIGKADGWLINSAHDTRDECWTAASRIPGAKYSDSSIGELLTLIKCLPDTIDPRRPKP
jgi:hypothetical protein